MVAFFLMEYVFIVDSVVVHLTFAYVHGVKQNNTPENYGKLKDKWELIDWFMHRNQNN